MQRVFSKLSLPPTRLEDALQGKLSGDSLPVDAFGYTANISLVLC